MKNKHAGSTFDSFLEEEKLEAEVAARVAKRMFVEALERKMVSSKKNKSAFRKALRSPTTTDRLFSDHVGVSLETLAKAAAIVGCELDIRLVQKGKKRAA